MFWKKKAPSETNVANPVSILCRFWHEDDVWNGTAEDLPVAVFGRTFEEAMKNLRNAIISHLESVRKGGDLIAVVSHLQERAREYGFLSPDEISPDSPIVKMLVAVRNQEILALTD